MPAVQIRLRQQCRAATSQWKSARNARPIPNLGKVPSALRLSRLRRKETARRRGTELVLESDDLLRRPGLISLAFCPFRKSTAATNFYSSVSRLA